MKIVLLNDRIPPEGMGGAEAVVWRLARGLQGAGQETHVIAATKGEPFEEVRDGIPTTHLHADYPERFRAWLSLWNPQTAGPLRRLLRRLEPDVVNAHNIHFYLSYHALKMARDLGLATVFSGHDAMPVAYGKLRHFVRADADAIQLPRDYRLPAVYNLRQNRFRYNPWRNRVIGRYLRRHALLLTAASSSLADVYSANDLPRPEVAHNGIDPAEWAPPQATLINALRDRLELGGKRVILIVGRLSAEKGAPQLLRAVDRIRADYPDLRVLALTARDISAQIPAAWRHLSPLICSAGWLEGDELRAAYHLADVVVVPSVVFDSFPTVNLEAMAAGKPVIATCFGGSREVVVDGDTGYIVNPLDTATFADRLGRLLGDESRRREMGERGQARIRAAFTLSQQVERMLEVFERSLKISGAKIGAEQADSQTWRN